jgi:uncharacterized membrane protein
MKVLKVIMSVVGVLMVLMGLLWIGQGLNIIKWPASSFMINVPVWSWRGAGLAVLGIGLLVFSRRK